jgi:hypothetical protein
MFCIILHVKSEKSVMCSLKLQVIWHELFLFRSRVTTAPFLQRYDIYLTSNKFQWYILKMLCEI